MDGMEWTRWDERDKIEGFGGMDRMDGMAYDKYEMGWTR